MDEVHHIRTQRARRSLRLAVDQAACHATVDELTDLRRLVQLERLGHVPTEQARTIVADLRRAQAARRDAA